MGQRMIRVIFITAILLYGNAIFSEESDNLSADDYFTRAKFVEGVLVADHIQVVVGIYFIMHDTWPISISQAAAADPADQIPDLPTNIVQSASLGPNGALTILFRPTVPGLANKSFLMSPTPRPDGGISWKCSAPDIPEIYRSKKCR
jgi:hypothetical protein